MRKWIVTAALALTLLAAGRAHASGTGYLCIMDYSPQPGGNGNYGYLWLSVTSGANCTGTAVTTATVCTTGGNCPVVFSENAMLALLHTLRDSMVNARRFYFGTMGTNPVLFAIEMYASQ